MRFYTYSINLMFMHCLCKSLLVLPVSCSWHSGDRNFCCRLLNGSIGHFNCWGEVVATLGTTVVARRYIVVASTGVIDGAGITCEKYHNILFSKVSYLLFMCSMVIWPLLYFPNLPRKSQGWWVKVRCFLSRLHKVPEYFQLSCCWHWNHISWSEPFPVYLPSPS